MMMIFLLIVHILSFARLIIGADDLTVVICNRHGIRQLRSGWADGPAYITQCPIQTGQSYVYNFTIVGQRGTLFWHAHISWLRSTVYGPLIIHPKRGDHYPFVKPDKEVPLIFGKDRVGSLSVRLLTKIYKLKMGRLSSKINSCTTYS